ncbi:MAG: DNA gyrase/topoisomerase IV subunit A [Sphingobacteriales bacterium]|jgi:topoisomerase-4 subunit A|nr:DNA gyrase/topoisomerase IV subunit A [Sphingobacteriales bacterium]
MSSDKTNVNGLSSGEHQGQVATMYENWFLEYASYVILERAVPYLDDGLKPVQRRVLHSMWELEDGRYNKVANVIGHTMKYHPHGDVSIGDALVQLGQKNLLIDTQGNWGNVYTGDSAAASRYIEARLSKFAQDVVFNPKTSIWQSSYDGRNKEPVTLPVKFPLLLAQGVEGIAVGLACKILPHNFCELIEASIDAIRGKTVNLLPDFFTGGVADFSKYNDGLRGGRIRVRSVIEKVSRKLLAIREIPFGCTTSSLIDSILSANDKGKIKIKKVEDNTAAKVEILIHLHPDSSEDLDKTIEALYAFTDCEVSISPNSCVIVDGRPVFLSVNEILRLSALNTQELLRRELQIELSELEEDWHFSSLEKIFIEKRIYRDIEECTTWESVISTIHAGLKPYKKKFLREITDEDVVRLTEIKIKRISKFDAFKANEHIRGLEEKIAAVKQDLDNIKNYTVNYFKNLLKKYGKGRERRTQISEFEAIVASKVVISNARLYVNRAEGFVGHGLKKDEFISDCSDIDDVIAITADGKLVVMKIQDKGYVGKEILHVAVFRKDQDEQTVYNLVYQDGPRGAVMMKRFTVGGVTRDKPYDLTKGTTGSRILYLSVSSPDAGPTVIVKLKPKPKLRNLESVIHFGSQLIKGRGVQGNVVTKFPILRVAEATPEQEAQLRKKQPELFVPAGKEDKAQLKIEL